MRLGETLCCSAQRSVSGCCDLRVQVGRYCKQKCRAATTYYLAPENVTAAGQVLKLQFRGSNRRHCYHSSLPLHVCPFQVQFTFCLQNVRQTKLESFRRKAGQKQSLRSCCCYPNSYEFNGYLPLSLTPISMNAVLTLPACCRDVHAEVCFQLAITPASTPATASPSCRPRRPAS